MSKTFVYVGRLVRRKGLVFLAKAWKEVNEEHPDYKLVLVGSGNLQPDSVENELKELAKTNENIKIMPETNNVKDIMLKADVFILPSELEGLSNVLLESMALEMKIIATNIGGNVELIKNGETGLLFTPNDEKSLTCAIRSIFSMRDLGKNARRKVVENYSLDKVADKYIELYEKEY